MQNAHNRIFGHCRMKENDQVLRESAFERAKLNYNFFFRLRWQNNKPLFLKSCAHAPFNNWSRNSI